MYSLFFVFFFLCLCFCFLSCFYVLKNKKFFNSRLIIGGAKRGLPPILIIGGACPGCHRVYAYECGHLRTGGRKRSIFADVLYGRPLRHEHLMDFCSRQNENVTPSPVN